MEVCWFLIIKIHQLNRQAAQLISICFIYFLHGAVWRKVWFSVFSVNFFRNLLYVQSSFNIEDILIYLMRFNTFITDRLYPWRVVRNTHKLSGVAVLSLALFLHHHFLYSDISEVVVFYDLSVKNIFFWNHCFLFVFYFVFLWFTSMLLISS